MNETLDRAKEVVYNKDIKELLGLYNLYSSSLWNEKDQEWRLTCLSLVKEELFKRNIISSPIIDKLEVREDFEPVDAPGLLVHVNVDEDMFDILKNPYNLEEDLKNSNTIRELVKNDSFANALYGSLCNVDWLKNNIRWGCSWRYAGGLVADLRDVGEDYLYFYCFGNEGIVDPVVGQELAKLNWTYRVDKIER